MVGERGAGERFAGGGGSRTTGRALLLNLYLPPSTRQLARPFTTVLHARAASLPPSSSSHPPSLLLKQAAKLRGAWVVMHVSASAAGPRELASPAQAGNKQIDEAFDVTGVPLPPAKKTVQGGSADSKKKKKKREREIKIDQERR